MIYYNKRLKEVRKYCDFSQKDMARILNISQQHYSMYETGKRILNAEQVALICKYCNVSANYILGLSDDFKMLEPKD